MAVLPAYVLCYTSMSESRDVKEPHCSIWIWNYIGRYIYRLPPLPRILCPSPLLLIVAIQGRIQDFWRGGGSILGLKAKKGGGGPRGGPTLGPMLKSLYRGPKGGGGSGPPGPPWIHYCYWGVRPVTHILSFSLGAICRPAPPSNGFVYVHLDLVQRLTALTCIPRDYRSVF